MAALKQARAEEWLRKARHWRQLAASASDPVIASILRGLAEFVEYEMTAAHERNGIHDE